MAIFLAVRKRHERFENSVAIFLHVAISYVYHAPQNSAYSANTKRNRKQFHDWVLQTAKFVRARLLVALDYYQQNKKHTAKPIN